MHSSIFKLKFSIIKLSCTENLGPISYFPDGVFPNATSPGNLIQLRRIVAGLVFRLTTKTSPSS